MTLCHLQPERRGLVNIMSDVYFGISTHEHNSVDHTTKHHDSMKKVNGKVDKSKHRRRMQINISSLLHQSLHQNSEESFDAESLMRKYEIIIWIRYMCFSLSPFPFIFHILSDFSSLQFQHIISVQIRDAI